MTKKEGSQKLDVLAHELVPFHRILTKKETEEVLKRYNIELVNLPRIKETDPVCVALGARFGDVIKIIRHSPTTVETVNSYRFVVKSSH